MTTNYFIIGVLCLFLFFGCKKTDELAPQITLKGNDTISGILNESYIDPGVTAWDDTDGDISKKVKINSFVNINKVGFYPVFYDAVDEAGNQALRQIRTVEIRHSSSHYAGLYVVNDTVYYPVFTLMEYNGSIGIDSTMNNRLIVGRFLDADSLTVYFEIADNIIIFPYQEVLSTGSSNSGIFIQGNGFINDSTVVFSYMKDSGNITTLCRQTMKRISK